MSIDLDTLEASYIGGNFTIGSVPDTVLQLIAELRKVKAERDWLADTLAGYCSHTTGDEQANCGIMPCPKRKINIRCLDIEKYDWLVVAMSTVSLVQAAREAVEKKK